MKSDKEHICHCLLFVFIKREMLLMHTKLFIRHIMKIL